MYKRQRITYSQGFGVGNRKIELIGEGYFEVKRNEEVPFLVKTNSLLVKVLGTKFNFRDYPDDAEAIVSLSEGKVALNNLLKKEKEAFLLPNERVVLNKKNGRMHVEYSTVSNALQWTNGYLSLIHIYFVYNSKFLVCISPFYNMLYKYIAPC